MIPCPPKRWESAESSEYDPIRWKKWFRRLLKRKYQIPALREASKLIHQGQPQWKAAAQFSVDEREVRDYVNFINGRGDPIPKVYQDVIDHAYDQYNFDGAKLNFRAYVMSSATAFGLNPRALCELWEVSPDFYPSTVKQSKGVNEEHNKDKI